MFMSSPTRRLSTPSLGITYILLLRLRLNMTKVFQLPLSGSLMVRGVFTPVAFKSFQLPLSGSQNQLARYAMKVRLEGTFNSLSRDHIAYEAWAGEIRGGELSTPSLGITVRFCDADLGTVMRFQLPLSGSRTRRINYVPRQMYYLIFQLPLSGSPSPIPGFSGSPRLSAAAPLRTSVFSGHYLKI